MNRFSILILVAVSMLSAFEVALTENGQRTDGSKLWDIGYRLTELDDGDSVRITVTAVTTDDETLPCETFVLPSDTGYIAANGDYHIIWNIGADVPDREFYTRRIIIYLTAARAGIEPGVCNDIIDISAGYEHSMLLRSDGTVWTWGGNDQGQIGDMTLTDRTTPVQVRGIGGIGFLSGITDIVCGHYHNIVRNLTGNTLTWGKNHRGQLGIGIAGGAGGTFDPGYDSNVPVYVRNFTDTHEHENGQFVGGGKNHSLLVMSDGSMSSWGYNLSGQLGDGNHGGSGDGYDPGIDSDLPVRVRGTGGAGWLDNVVMTAGGAYHSLALLEDGTVRAWGSNFYGQLGTGTDGGDPSDYDADIDEHHPTLVLDETGAAPLGGIVFIAAGGYHSMAIDTAGNIWAWGRNNCGQLGISTTDDISLPQRVRGGEAGTPWLDNVVEVAGGGYHTVALWDDGTVWAWGDNFYGQLGNGGHTGAPGTYDPGTDRTRPVRVWDSDGTGYFGNAERIAAGWYHTLANTYDGKIWGWGNNDRGQLGDGSTTERYFPGETVLPW